MVQQTTTRDIVAKLWSLCHILRDDGVIGEKSGELLRTVRRGEEFWGQDGEDADLQTEKQTFANDAH